MALSLGYHGTFQPDPDTEGLWDRLKSQDLLAFSTVMATILAMEFSQISDGYNHN